MRKCKRYMGVCEDEIGGKGAPRRTRAYACDSKRSVELFKIYIFLKSIRSNDML